MRRESLEGMVGEMVVRWGDVDDDGRRLNAGHIYGQSRRH